MSKVAIQGNASGTGVFTITSPSGSTDRTLTLPDEAGTIVTSVSDLAAANLTGTIAKARLPAGSVLQVVSTTKTDTFSTTAGQASPAAITGLTVSITPTSSSSKVLVLWNVNYSFNGTATTYGIRLTRNGTGICIADAAGVRARMTAQGHGEGSSWNADVLAGTFLDSPASTSSLTYGMSMGNNGNASLTMFVNRTGRDINAANEDSRATSTITVMEVAA